MNVETFISVLVVDDDPFVLETTSLLLNAFNKDIPVVLMTAYAELNTAIDAIKKGAFDFIIKPFRPEYLLHSLEKAVNYYRLAHIEKNYHNKLEDDVKNRTKELADALRMLKETSKEK